MGKLLYPHNNSDFSLGKNEVELCIVTLKKPIKVSFIKKETHFFHKYLATCCDGWGLQEKIAKDNKVLWLDSIIQSIIFKHHLYSSPYWCYGCSKNGHDRVPVPKMFMFLLSDKENNQECRSIPWLLMTSQDEQQLACCSNQKCLFYQNWTFSPHFQLHFCLCVA